MLESITIEGNSPVGENDFVLLAINLSTFGKESPKGSRQNYSAKAKYSTTPIVN